MRYSLLLLILIITNCGDKIIQDNLKIIKQSKNAVVFYEHETVQGRQIEDQINVNYFDLDKKEMYQIASKIKLASNVKYLKSDDLLYFMTSSLKNKVTLHTICLSTSKIEEYELPIYSKPYWRYKHEVISKDEIIYAIDHLVYRYNVSKKSEELLLKVGDDSDPPLISNLVFFENLNLLAVEVFSDISSLYPISEEASENKIKNPYIFKLFFYDTSNIGNPKSELVDFRITTFSEDTKILVSNSVSVSLFDPFKNNLTKFSNTMIDTMYVRDIVSINNDEYFLYGSSVNKLPGDEYLGKYSTAVYRFNTSKPDEMEMIFQIEGVDLEFIINR